MPSVQMFETPVLCASAPPYLRMTRRHCDRVIAPALHPTKAFLGGQCLRTACSPGVFTPFDAVTVRPCRSTDVFGDGFLDVTS